MSIDVTKIKAGDLTDDLLADRLEMLARADGNPRVANWLKEAARRLTAHRTEPPAPPEPLDERVRQLQACADIIPITKPEPRKEWLTLRMIDGRGLEHIEKSLPTINALLTETYGSPDDRVSKREVARAIWHWLHYDEDDEDSRNIWGNLIHLGITPEDAV